jgi:hypothetical protein
MAQLNTDRLQITGFSGMNNSTWTPVVCPLNQARGLRIVNNDGTNAISITTDTADATAVSTVKVSSDILIQLQSKLLRGWVKGETVLYVKGAGSQPVLHWTA